MKFNKCNMEELIKVGYIDAYVKALSSPIDSFIEEHILKSQYFFIENDGVNIGFVSINNEELLTQFYMDRKFRDMAQDVFHKVLKLQKVRFALVPTCDEFFLSHAMDNFKSLDKQAYFFKDSRDKDAYIKSDIDIRVAVLDDINNIKKNSGEFFDLLEERIPRGEIYVATKEDKEVGYGIMEKGKIAKEFISIGMFVFESCRQQGIGKSIIRELIIRTYNEGRKPIAGCWYYNHNSKKTLESAGLISNTRLLKISY